MNLLVKSIFISMFCSLSLVAMDGDRKREAEQAIGQDRPVKENIAKAIIQTNILPNVLASVIAGYAENPYKGYMFLVPTRAAKVSEFIPGYLEEYQDSFPELGQGLTQDSFMCDTWVSSMPSCSDDVDPKPWHAHHCPYLPSAAVGTNFPHCFPASLLKNLKEDDIWYVTIKGVPFALECSQLSHRYRVDLNDQEPFQPFEKAFSKVTLKFNGLLGPAKEQIDEDQQ